MKINIFEVLITDNSGKTEISTVKSLIMALSYSEKLWKEAEVRQTNNEFFIEDKALDIVLHASKTPLTLNQNETIFTLSATSPDQEKIAAFREKLLVHAIQKLGFDCARIITDSVSESISLSIYPLIKHVENRLRSYLQTALIQSAGPDWWKTIASDKLSEIISKRKTNEVHLSNFLDTNMALTDFDDLSEIALQTSLADQSFKTKWDVLTIIRKRVLVNSVFTAHDLISSEKLCAEILDLIPESTQKKGLSVIAETKTETPGKTKSATSVTPSKQENSLPEPVFSEPESTVNVPVTEYKAPQPILPSAQPEAEVLQQTKKDPAGNEGGVDFITEGALLQELKAVQNQENGFVDLKAFVTKTLGSKGYAFGPAYLMAKTMSEKGMLQIYDTRDQKGTVVKAIRVNS